MSRIRVSFYLSFKSPFLNGGLIPWLILCVVFVGSNGIQYADAAPEKIYWCSEPPSAGPGVTPAPGTIYSIDSSGSNRSTLYTAPTNTPIKACHYESVGRRIFMGESGYIYELKIDTLQKTQFQPPTISTWAGIAVDNSRSTLHWGGVDDGQLHAASSSTPNSTPTSYSFGGVFDTPVDIEIDATGGKLYVIGYDPDGRSGVIRRFDVDGTNGQTLVTGLVGARGLAIDPQNSRMFYTEGDPSRNRIWRANIDGTSQVDITSIIGSVSQPYDIDYDAGSQKIYWVQFNSSSSNGRLRRANADGTSAEDLVTTNIAHAKYLTLHPDTTTQPGNLSSPASGLTSVTNLPIAYSLPESAASGTTQVLFKQGSSVLATLNMIDADSVSTSVQPLISAPVGNSSVISSTGFPLSPGTYDVVLSYQDSLQNPAASTTNSNIVLSLPTATPTSTPTTTFTPTNTATPTSSPTLTATQIPTLTPTLVPTQSPTATSPPIPPNSTETPTPVPTATVSPLPTEVPQLTPTADPTPVVTPTATSTPGCKKPLGYPSVEAGPTSAVISFNSKKGTVYTVLGSSRSPRGKAIERKRSVTAKTKSTAVTIPLPPGIWRFIVRSSRNGRNIESCAVMVPIVK